MFGHADVKEKVQIPGEQSLVWTRGPHGTHREAPSKLLVQKRVLQRQEVRAKDGHLPQRPKPTSPQ